MHGGEWAGLRFRHHLQVDVEFLPAVADAGAGDGRGAGSIEADKLRPALETVAIDSIKGHVAMRACDHQAEQQGFMVKVVRKEGFKDPIPELVATFPADQITPACRQMTYDS